MTIAAYLTEARFSQFFVQLFLLLSIYYFEYFVIFFFRNPQRLVLVYLHPKKSPLHVGSCIPTILFFLHPNLNQKERILTSRKVKRSDFDARKHLVSLLFLAPKIILYNFWVFNYNSQETIKEELAFLYLLKVIKVIMHEFFLFPFITESRINWTVGSIEPLYLKLSGSIYRRSSFSDWVPHRSNFQIKTMFRSVHSQITLSHPKNCLLFIFYFFILTAEQWC